LNKVNIDFRVLWEQKTKLDAIRNLWIASTVGGEQTRLQSKFTKEKLQLFWYPNSFFCLIIAWNFTRPQSSVV
jgi:hypothetical protein